MRYFKIAPLALLGIVVAFGVGFETLSAFPTLPPVVHASIGGLSAFGAMLVTKRVVFGH